MNRVPARVTLVLTAVAAGIVITAGGRAPAPFAPAGASALPPAEAIGDRIVRFHANEAGNSTQPLCCPDQRPSRARADHATL